MRAAGMMSTLVTPYVRTTAKGSHGATEDTFTAGTPVWGRLSRATERQQMVLGATDTMADYILTVDAGSWTDSTNRVSFDGITCDVVSTDRSGWTTHLGLREVR